MRRRVQRGRTVALAVLRDALCIAKAPLGSIGLVRSSVRLTAGAVTVGLGAAVVLMRKPSQSVCCAFAGLAGLGGRHWDYASTRCCCQQPTSDCRSLRLSRNWAAWVSTRPLCGWGRPCRDQAKRSAELRTAGYTVATRSPKTTKPSGLRWAKSLISLVPVKGVEPSTFALRMRCSTN
jgi:hypothetical protein